MSVSSIHVGIESMWK